MTKNNLIKLLSPSVSSKEISAVRNVLKSGWWGMGPVTAEFENKFAEFANAKYAIAVNSATAALHLSLKVLDKKGKVITPALTFISTAAVSLYENCEVEFADIDEKTYCLDPDDVNKKIDKNTIAVIPVHYAGRLADMEYKNNIPIIEDAAHACGTSGAGMRGLLTCWSFHAVKNIAMGDGGMITTNDEILAKRLRKLRWFGIDLSTYDREKKGYNWEYDIKELGYKYHTNDILAAIGLSQLKRIKILNKKRKIIAEKYNKELKNLPVILPPLSGSWHLYVIRVDKKYRNKLIDFLREKNISPGVHYKPLYYYPIFGKPADEAKKNLPVTEKIWQEIISLPIHPDLMKFEQERVINALRKFFNHA